MVRPSYYTLGIIITFALLVGCGSPTSTPVSVAPTSSQNTAAIQATSTTSGVQSPVSSSTVTPPPAVTTSTNCRLLSASRAIQHVIVIQFDNVHLTRDNPNVPSDLEQMPHLLQFITGSGGLLTNYHTPLIAHTGTDLLTALTGVYPDRHGMPIANTYRYYRPGGKTNMAVSFAYWTAPLNDPTTGKPLSSTLNLIDESAKNPPAPWVPFTRAGCNFGAVATANMVLENALGDAPLVFGADSDEAQLAVSHSGQADADLVGLAIHCAAGETLCSNRNGGRPDNLPDEPGGYAGFMALYGNKYVAPQISPESPVADLDGQVIQSSTGHIGFPGFDDMRPSVSLAYVAAMQEHGVPITFDYISSAHYERPDGESLGPGDPKYVKALGDFDSGFAKFFARLKKSGIDSSNTLFIFASDEGDHLVAGTPNPPNCDGIKVTCAYPQLGQIYLMLASLLSSKGITTSFDLHADTSPAVYVTGKPSRTDPVTRKMERAVSSLTVKNPYSGQTDQVSQLIVDEVGMKILHMITANSARTPTFAFFANPNYYLSTNMPKRCGTDPVCIFSPSAWSHGDLAPDINVTWAGFVGPGVRSLGMDNTIWSDHTDLRPTMMALLGLKDDYASDGRVLVKLLDDSAMPASLSSNKEIASQLGQMYKQINAPVGQLSIDSLKISTAALSSDSPGDATFNQLEDQLTAITTERDALASKISALLGGAEFDGKAIDPVQANQLLTEGQALLDRAKSLAAGH